MSGGEPVRREVQVIDRQGRSARWEFTAMPYRDKNGCMMGIIDVGQNISPLKSMAYRLQGQNKAIHDRCEHLESQLDILREYCAMVVGEVKHGVLTLRSGAAVGASKGLLGMFGLASMEGLRGRRFLDMLIHGHRELAESLLERWSAGHKENEGVHLKAVRADGTLFDIRVRPNGGQGTSPDVLRLDITDITELEQDRPEAEQETFALFPAPPADVVIIGENHRIEYLNPSARDIYGHAEGQMCFEALYGAESPCDECVMAKLLEDSGQVIRRMVERQDRVYEEAIRGLTCDRDGRRRLMIVSRDVTHCVREGGHSQSSRKMEAIGLLAGKIAHDFNNILAGVMGAASLIKEVSDEGSDMLACAELIEKSSETGRNLTRNLQLFATGGKARRKPVFLNEVLMMTAELFRKGLGGKWPLETRLADDLWATESDPDQMHQIVMNLCKNASEAMPRGGAISLESRNTTLRKRYCVNGSHIEPGRYIEIVVRDHGDGMDHETLEKCFEPMYSTKGKGRGFGLATVFGIVKSHGGWVTVDSKKDVGTTIAIGLPASDKVPEVKQPAKRIDALPHGDETVLLVDDEQAIRETGARMLKGLGYSVMTAADGHEAVERMTEDGQSVGLVILDVVMPRMGGAEAHRLIRDRYPDVKILISSGYEIEGPPKALLKDEHTQFLQKPYRMNELAESVRMALGAVVE